MAELSYLDVPYSSLTVLPWHSIGHFDSQSRVDTVVNPQDGGIAAQKRRQEQARKTQHLSSHGS